MKEIRKVLILLIAVSFTVACSSLDDDDHYSKYNTDIQNNELKIVNMSSEDYIKTRPDLSDMNDLFLSDSIYKQLDAKGQRSTILVVTNNHFKMPDAKNMDFIAKSHISDIEMSPANLSNGERLMMWHGKYVNVDIDSLGQAGQIINHIMFNNATVNEVIKTNDGYIYVISDMINTPISLYDYINNLDDNYSIFKNIVINSGSKIFDKSNSKVIGVNEQGNTVYDSVFIYKNAFFDSQGFDMNSESLTATMLLFSNDVINDALNDAKNRLDSWNMTCNQDTLKKWVLKTAFYNKKYSASQIQTTEVNDLSSIFGTQWRTNVQKVDVGNPIALSNGVVYKVKKLHFPNNLLIYRLKDWFYYYENCTDEQKVNYFKTSNLVFSQIKTAVSAWTPLSGVWPLHEDRVLIYAPGEQGNKEGFQLDFTLIKLHTNADSTTSVVPYLIPPGTYRLAMGFVQNQNLDITVSVLVNGQVIAESPLITLGSSTAYHYDRGSTLPNCYPEGYDVSAMIHYNKKAGNYDTDGGPIIDEVTIPDAKGDSSPVQVTLRIKCADWNGQKKLTLNHWCLRPTLNNY
jgi:hypothetical protein